MKFIKYITGIPLIIGGGLTILGYFGHYLTIFLLLIGLFLLYRLIVDKSPKFSSVGFYITAIGFLISGSGSYLITVGMIQPTAILPIAVLILLGFGLSLLDLALFRSDYFPKYIRYPLAIGFGVLIVTGWPVILGAGFIWYGVMIVLGKIDDNLSISTIESSASEASRINLVGLYSEPTDSNVSIIEVEIKNSSEKFDIGSFTQKIVGVDAVNWKVPYDEKVLNSNGTSIKSDPFMLRDVPEDWIGNVRLLFFFHFLDPKLPLSTPFGTILLPRASKKPDRLNFYKYESPG